MHIDQKISEHLPVFHGTCIINNLSSIVVLCCFLVKQVAAIFDSELTSGSSSAQLTIIPSSSDSGDLSWPLASPPDVQGTTWHQVGSHKGFILQFKAICISITQT